MIKQLYLLSTTLFTPFNSFKRITTNYDEARKVTINIEHNYNDNVKTLVLNKVREIESRIWTDTMSLEDKIKASHDYIINHSRYDKDRSDNGVINYQSDIAYGPPTTRLQSLWRIHWCHGIILRRFKGQSYKISNDKHVWNGVNLGNNWYHLDLTWDDPITSNNQDILEYTYFLVGNDDLEQADNNNQHNLIKVFI